MKKVRITVLKKEFYADFAEEYLTDKKPRSAPALYWKSEIRLFLRAEHRCLTGFCPWAWIDLYHNISAISSGSTYAPWNNRDGLTIACCMDGIRPVIFKIESIEDDPLIPFSG